MILRSITNTFIGSFIQKDADDSFTHRKRGKQRNEMFGKYFSYFTKSIERESGRPSYFVLHKLDLVFHPSFLFFVVWFWFRWDFARQIVFLLLGSNVSLVQGFSNFFYDEPRKGLLQSLNLTSKSTLDGFLFFKSIILGHAWKKLPQF